MEDKLVTLATLTYNKALILKSVLEKEGINVCIVNLRQLQPVVSSGVRVRIKESDLPQALQITESSVWLSESVVGEKVPTDGSENEEILVPVDFSEYSMRACEIAFHLAEKGHYQLTLLHVYFTPVLTSALPYGDAFNFPLGSEEDGKEKLKKVQTDLNTLSDTIKKKITTGEFPNMLYNCVLKEGIPEEEIFKYTKDHHPKLIIMGTRGKHKKDIDLMGSVTAEVIERSRTSILAIPENTQIRDFKDVRHIAFLTNFEQRDLIAFDAFIKSWKPYQFSVSLLHLAETPNKWNEIKLGGIKEYFHRQYPTLDLHYDVVMNDDLLKSLDEYIKINKIDIIALTSYKRKIFSQLFNPSMARKMIFHSDTPLLVINIHS
jgi:nucleotide-binding universal stress UspA family protein